MRREEAVKGQWAPASDLSSDAPGCATKAHTAAFSRRSALCFALILAALSGCGSVQTTTSTAPSSIPESVTNPQPPVVSGFPPTSALVGVPYDYTPAVSDTLSTALTFDITNMPSWATFNTATGELKGTPGTDDVGRTNDIEIGVSDGTSRATIGPFRITIAAAQSTTPPAAPTISGTPPASIVAGQTYFFAPSASDPNGEALTFLIVNRPAWASFSTSTGQLSGVPTAANVGSYANVTISVSDGTLTTSLPAFTITVSAPSTDGPPTISGTPATAVNAGSAYSFTPSASDPGGNALTFSIQNQPSWTSFNTNTGQVSGTPALADVGSYPNIMISVSDGTLAATLPAFSVTVSTPSVNGPPTISGTPATAVNVGSAYSFTPSASDPEGNPLTFSVQNLPSWAAFDAGTGRLSGTPTAANLGSFPNITISVSDGTMSASLPAFTITVSTLAVDGPPTIGGTPETSVSVGSTYSFTPTARDPQGHALTFSIQNRPSWMAFSAGTGRLSGTPTAANLGSFPNITISVSNGSLATSLTAFTLTVTASVDGPPTISGHPAASVNVGSAYSFTPNANDPEGHTLTFSIENQPAWTSFNASTGQLSGTPAAANVGSYANIIIRVSNGTLMASLPAFSIAVTQISTASVTVNWSTPTQNTNGTALVNLAGFRIYYGTSASNLSQSEQIANPGVTSYVLANLAPGTWYIGLADYTTSGVESSLSNIASTTVQ
jgi:hypothetical protein